MSRLALFLILAVAIYLWLKKMVAGPRPAATDGKKALPEAMLKCARCGVHFPAGEAIVRNGSAFCSRPHADGGNS